MHSLLHLLTSANGTFRRIAAMHNFGSYRRCSGHATSPAPWHRKWPLAIDGQGHLLEGNKIEIRRSSVVVATSQERHRPPRSDRGGQHRR